MAVNTLYDYFKSTGKAMPSVSGRTADATKAGITNYYFRTTYPQINQQQHRYSRSKQSASPAPVSTTPTVNNVATTSTAPKTTPVVNPTTTPNTQTTTPTTVKTGTGVIKTETLTPNQTTTAGKNTVENTYKQLNLADLGAGIDNRASALADKQYNDYVSQGGEVVDEQAIRKSFRDRVQSQIDGINNAYASMMANAKVKSTGDQGVARAVNARSGLLGSDFATADEMNISKAGTDMQNSLEAERASKINALLNEADDSATSYLTTKRQQVQSANDNAMKLLLTRESSKAGTASKIAQYLLAKGVKSLDEISHDDMAKIQSDYGLSLADIASAFNGAYSTKTKADQEALLTNAKIQNEINSGRFKSVSDGSYLYDTQTGQYVENPKNFAPKTAGSTAMTVGGMGGGAITSVEDAMQRIANIESRGSKDRFGGNNQYQVVSVPSANGDKAYGKYQVMGSNIPVWTKEVLGKSLNIEQFLNSPEAQDAVAREKLQQAYDKHGSWADSASVWFSGRPLAGNTSKDILGTSTPMYVSKFMDQGGSTEISPEAQMYVDAIKSGRRTEKEVLDTLGSSATLEPIRRQVIAGINGQSQETMASKNARDTISTIDQTIATLERNVGGTSNLVGTFRTRQADNPWLNPYANDNTAFVNTVDKLTGQLMQLDGKTLKEIFGPQISNSDAGTIKEIIGKAINPKNQTPTQFQASLDDIKRKLAISKSQYGSNDIESNTQNDFSDIQQHITIKDGKAYIPRNIWMTLGGRQDALLQEAKNDGYTLLIN